MIIQASLRVGYEMKRSRTNLPARYPPVGAWPAQMRADMAAAYLDYADTDQLATAISRGEAPAPCCLRGKGRKREPVWNKDTLDGYLVPRTWCNENRDDRREDLRGLV
jgi:hypothetical protein